jgi:hypothetical protein
MEDGGWKNLMSTLIGQVTNNFEVTTEKPIAACSMGFFDLVL